jgi:hypothetical protein
MKGQFTKADQKDYKDDRNQLNFSAPSDLWAHIAFMTRESAARTAAYSLARYYSNNTNQKNKELRWNEAQIALCDANPLDCRYINDVRRDAKQLKAEGITASETP